MKPQHVKHMPWCSKMDWIGWMALWGNKVVIKKVEEARIAFPPESDPLSVGKKIQIQIQI